MLLPKSPPIRSQKLRDAARGQSCVRCGSEDETVVLAHLPISGEFGTGLKTHDIVGAHLCRPCHEHVDGPEGRRDYELRFHLLVETQVRLMRQGVLCVR